MLALVEGARWLQRAGASCVAVSCDTAHASVEQLAKAAGVEVLDMIEAAREAAAGKVPGVKRVGSSRRGGTPLAGLYERAGARPGLEVIQVPDRVPLEYVDAAIRAVKGGADLAGPERWIAEAAGNPGAGRTGGRRRIYRNPAVSGAAAGVLPLVDSTEALVDAVLYRLWRADPFDLASSWSTSPERRDS
ncbi:MULTISPECIES: aspartate/glutamate racemase family protein [Streptomyces]|uniref:aspartate/glutamate racemase family protein n=1 Tax=Streptomyces TaxID=1883 RepID=UPI0027DCF29A|nr:aspartate/glutamate racemase family protein [Streptomyces sp. 9-7]